MSDRNRCTGCRQNTTPSLSPPPCLGTGLSHKLQGDPLSLTPSLGPSDAINEALARNLLEPADH